MLLIQSAYILEAHWLIVLLHEDRPFLYLRVFCLYGSTEDLNYADAMQKHRNRYSQLFIIQTEIQARCRPLYVKVDLNLYS